LLFLQNAVNIALAVQDANNGIDSVYEPERSVQASPARQDTSGIAGRCRDGPLGE
jgi:hypothetical protein